MNVGALPVSQASTKRKSLRDQAFSAGDGFGVWRVGLGSRHRRKSKALRRLTLGLVTVEGGDRAQCHRSRMRQHTDANVGEFHSRKTIPFSSEVNGADYATQTGRTTSRVGTTGNVVKLQQ
jgi:hypothetical protein